MENNNTVKEGLTFKKPVFGIFEEPNEDRFPFERIPTHEEVKEDDRSEENYGIIGRINR